MNSLQYRQLAKRIDKVEKQLVKIEKALEALAPPKPRKETLHLNIQSNNA